MKKKIFIIVLLLVLIPFNVYAISSNYNDVVSKYTGVKIEKNKINLYLFYSKECPHCEDERKWLKTIKKDYEKYLNVYEYEVLYNEDNSKIMQSIKKDLNIRRTGVPYTVIGESSYVGYSDSMSNVFENKIKEYLELENNPNEVSIPFLGKINLKTISIPFLAVVLGFVDGFNPCAMWILLFLISMLFGMKNKSRRWILGITFLFVSSLVYFLSMIGINFILGIATINYMKIGIALFILIAGFLNLKKYLKIRKEEVGCSVVDDKKRKRIIKKMKGIIDSRSFLFSVLGIVVLAVSVNLVELACSLGFPLIFTETLAINEVTGISKIIYLLIYIFFYMIDDMLVFIISMITLEATGITNKYNKLCTLVSAIIMIIMGILLLIRPDWLMLNF